MFEIIPSTIQGINVSTGWSYVESDPYAITVSFLTDPDEPEIEWVFARETLHDALNSESGVAGEGDVTWLIEGHIAYLLLTSQDGAAKVLFNKEQVSKFLWDTLDIAQFGHETVNVDSWIEQFFNTSI